METFTYLKAKSGSKKQNQNTSYISTVYFPCLVSHFNYWLVVGFICREREDRGGVESGWEGQHLAQFMTRGILSKQFSFNSNNNRYLLSTLGGHFLINRIDLAVAAQPCNFPT